MLESTQMDNKPPMTNDEWNEMASLKDAINFNIASVHPEKMEKFTELFVKSLQELTASSESGTITSQDR